jgi:hypothetical protein
MTKKWKIVLLVFFSLVVILITAGALLRRNTKKHSPVDKISFNEGGLTLESVYCQPYKKGRKIFGTEDEGALQPFGEYWRMGANEATTLEANRDITFGGKQLKSGKYSIYAVPGEEIWRIGVNPDANRWGVPAPSYDKDVISIDVPVTYGDDIVEQLKIDFVAGNPGAIMVIKWEKSIIKIPIK